jgi:uncharacterized protein (TIGR03435 family)
LPAYDTVSIRPKKSDQIGNSGFRADGYASDGTNLTDLIMLAFNLKQQDQVHGIPKWASSANYAIVAKVDPADLPLMRKLKYSERCRMLQPVLEERFSLRYHWGSKILPALKLEASGNAAKLLEGRVGPNGESKMGEASVQSGALVTGSDGGMVAREITMRQLADFLTDARGIYVLDETGLTGRYSFVIHAPQNEESSPSPLDSSRPFDPYAQIEIIQAALSQIGLKLVPAKAEVSVMEIDHLSPPTPN